MSLEVEKPVIVNGDTLEEREVRKWREGRGFVLLYPHYPDETTLDKDWADFNNMHLEERRRSDWKSIELFGFRNKDRYEKMKHEFLKRNSLKKPEPTDDLYPKQKEAPSEVIVAPVSESMLMKPETIIDKIISESAQESIINSIRSINRVNYGGTPFFTAPEMQYMGTSYSKSPRYSKTPTITSLNGIKNSDWWKNYSDTLNGWNGNTLTNYSDWKRTIKQLSDKLQSCNELEEQMNIKQALLDFGWNPSVACTEANFRRATKRVNSIMSESVKHITIIDITESVNRSFVVRENDTESSMAVPESQHPLFIVFYNSKTQFNKLTRIFDNSIYSHVGISLTPNLSKIYSFSGEHNGLMVEDVHAITDAKTIEVFVIYINASKKALIEKNIQHMLVQRFQYSFLNLISIPLKIDYVSNTKMVCSQFADFVLKLGDIDLTNLASNMVSPGTLHKEFKKKRKNRSIYKIYYGHPSKYDVQKVNAYVASLPSSVKESTNPIVNKYFTFTEAKDVSIQFDEDGNLLIDKGTNLDFEAEYSKCHLAMKQYEKAGNIEGMKYGLCKLWYLNGLLEEKIHSTKDEKERQKYYKVRAHILGDIHHYMAVVQKKDPNFDMLQAYEESPFSDDKVRIRRSTLLYTIDIIKRMVGIKI